MRVAAALAFGFFFSFIMDDNSLHIILPSFIEIGQELFEIIEEKTHPHTHPHTNTQTDTYTRMKIIPVQKQSFWAR